MNRKIKVGISDEFLNMMSLHDLFNMFQNEFDESVKFYMSERNNSTSYTFFTLESPNFKDSKSTPVIFLKKGYATTEDGPQDYFYVEDYSEYVDGFSFSIKESTLPGYFNVIENDNHISPRAGTHFPGLDEIQKQSEKKESKLIADDKVYKWWRNPIHFPQLHEVEKQTDQNEFSYIPSETESKELIDIKIIHPFQLASTSFIDPETLKLLKDLYGDPVSEFSEGPLVELSCEHEWKEYNGFSERYKYCSKCDEKDK